MSFIFFKSKFNWEEFLDRSRKSWFGPYSTTVASSSDMLRHLSQTLHGFKLRSKRTTSKKLVDNVLLKWQNRYLPMNGDGRSCRWWRLIFIWLIMICFSVNWFQQSHWNLKSLLYRESVKLDWLYISKLIIILCSKLTLFNDILING